MPRHWRILFLPPPLLLAAVLLLQENYFSRGSSWRLFGRKAADAEVEDEEGSDRAEKIEASECTAEPMSEEQLQQAVDKYEGDVAVFFYTRWDAPSRHLLAIWESTARMMCDSSKKKTKKKKPECCSSSGHSLLSPSFSRLPKVSSLLSFISVLPRRLLQAVLPPPQQQLKLYTFDCQQSSRAGHLCQGLGLPFLPSILFFSAAPLRSTTTCSLSSSSSSSPSAAAAGAQPTGQPPGAAHREAAAETSAEAAAAAAAVGEKEEDTAGEDPATGAMGSRRSAATAAAAGAAGRGTDAEQQREVQQQQQQQEQRWYFFDEKEDTALPLRCARYKGDFFVQEAVVDWLKMMRVISYAQQLLRQGGPGSSDSSSSSDDGASAAGEGEKEEAEAATATAALEQLQQENVALQREIAALRQQVNLMREKKQDKQQCNFPP